MGGYISIIHLQDRMSHYRVFIAPYPEINSNLEEKSEGETKLASNQPRRRILL